MPAPSDARTVAADARVRAGRLAKAKQFLQVADDALELAENDDISDAAATLYVHAGIAAADALCARALGKHARGESHQQAIQLLAGVDAEAAHALKALLSMKTRAGYGHDPIGTQDLRRAARSARLLVEKASL